MKDIEYFTKYTLVETAVINETKRIRNSEKPYFTYRETLEKIENSIDLMMWKNDFGHLYPMNDTDKAMLKEIADSIVKEYKAENGEPTVCDDIEYDIHEIEPETEEIKNSIEHFTACRTEAEKRLVGELSKVPEYKPESWFYSPFKLSSEKNVLKEQEPKIRKNNNVKSNDKKVKIATNFYQLNEDEKNEYLKKYSKEIDDFYISYVQDFGRQIEYQKNRLEKLEQEKNNLADQLQQNKEQAQTEDEGIAEGEIYTSIYEMKKINADEIYLFLNSIDLAEKNENDLYIIPGSCNNAHEILYFVLNTIKIYFSASPQLKQKNQDTGRGFIKKMSTKFYYIDTNGKIPKDNMFKQIYKNNKYSNDELKQKIEYSLRNF